MLRDMPAADDPRRLRADIRRLRKELASLAPSLDVMLRRRGFVIHKKNPSEDLIVPDRDYDSAFYEKMKKYSFRLFLRDVIRFQDSFSITDVTKFATRSVSAGYTEFLLKAGVVERHRNSYRLTRRPIKSFGETLECFMARLVRNHFQAEVFWGVRFKKRGVGGDYDLIARIDNKLFYMEIKSSPPKQIYDREIDAFLDRLSDLSPDLSAFFVDTELRMKDKIVPMFEQALQRRFGIRLPVRRIVRELFHINRKIFIINAKAGIASNIDTILACYWHKPFEID